MDAQCLTARPLCDESSSSNARPLQSDGRGLGLTLGPIVRGLTLIIVLVLALSRAARNAKLENGRL